MTPTQIVHLRASFILLQNADYPFFTKSLTFHPSSSFIKLKVENSSSQWPGFRGKGHPSYGQAGQGNLIEGRIRWIREIYGPDQIRY